MNTITTKGGTPSHIVLSTITGVILTLEGKMLLIYDAAKLHGDQRRMFERLVGTWVAAIKLGATRLPVNLYHGGDFEAYEPLLIGVDFGSVIETTGYVYMLREHFPDEYVIRRYEMGKNGVWQVGAIKRRKYQSEAKPRIRIRSREP